MSYGVKTNRERAEAAIPAGIVHGLIAYALVAGFSVDLPEAARDTLRMVRLMPEEVPRPEPSVPPAPEPIFTDVVRPAADPREEGAASPPNLRSRATELALPEPVIQLPVPNPLVVADKPGTGRDRTSGNADVPGPGTGSGGFGEGSGSGWRGDGPGGGGYGYPTPPRLIRGSLRDSDYPRGLGELGVQGTVSVLYAVQPNGRVTNCVVTRSSGSRELDQTTCRLIEQRFRFEPSRDGRGRPIQSQIVENHSWEVREDPDERRGRY